MTNLSPLARTIILIIAVAVAALMAPDAFDLLPQWAQVLVGVCAAVVAAIVVPPMATSTSGNPPAPPANPNTPVQ